MSGRPFARPGRASTLALVLGLVLGTLACSVDVDEFQDRVFHCDKAAPDPLCGTDRAGQPMTCFAARQLGGADFCVERCEAPMSLPDEDATCVQGNAKLEACDPQGEPGVVCGRPELGCLRTDVTRDEGVCVTMQPCTEDTDCRDSVRSTCAATFFKRLYKDKPDLRSDHLYCLQEGCIAGAAACSPGETCLKNVIPEAANPPDICVPNCDSNLQCPPNHFCYRKISGPANPAVCIPGLLGFVCETDVDCLVGRCVDDGSAALVGTPDATGLRLCTIDCASDDECARFDSEQGKFMCNADGHCASPSAYRGASCDTQADCTRNPGTLCTWFSETAKVAGDQGTCIYPCRGGDTCPAYGGINHTCLPGLAEDSSAVSACFPGFFGIPCATDDNCAGGLSCRGADPTAGRPGFCTTLCADDRDCDDNHWATGGSTCVAPICVPLLADGEPCREAKQCQSKVCTESARNPTVMLCGGA